MQEQADIKKRCLVIIISTVIYIEDLEGMIKVIDLLSQENVKNKPYLTRNTLRQKTLHVGASPSHSHNIPVLDLCSSLQSY